MELNDKPEWALVPGDAVVFDGYAVPSIGRHAPRQRAPPEESQERTDQHQSDHDPADALNPPRTTLILEVLIDLEIGVPLSR